MIPRTVKPEVTTTKHLFCADDLCGGMYLCSHLQARSSGTNLTFESYKEKIEKKRDFAHRLNTVLWMLSMLSASGSETRLTS